MTYRRKEVIGKATLYLGDCMEVMPLLDKVDAVVTDPPYGTTACKWDNIIPFDEMWKCCEKVRNEKTPIILFGSEPFSSSLRMTNIKNYKYDWVWTKKLAGNGILAKKQPLKIHEIYSVFYNHNYYPVMKKGLMRNKMGVKKSEINCGDGYAETTYNDDYYPESIVEYSLAGLRTDRFHPTQKPVDLLKYICQTYTKNYETVLDFTMGSGSTGVAAVQMGREFIGIELDEDYFEIACKRIEDAQRQGDMFV